MRRMWLRVAAAMVALAFLSILWGCGGSGTGSSSGGGPGSGSNGTLGLFVTDQATDGFAGVWATLYRVEVAQANGPFRTVYEADEGVELNIPELSDTVELLGTASLPAGSYVRARVTLRNTMRVIEGNGSGSDVPLRVGQGTGFAAGPQETCVAEMPVSVTVPGNGHADVILDFDLARFQMVGNALQAHIRQANRNEIAVKKWRARLVGIVENLRSGAGFDLRLRSGRTVAVALDEDTSVISASTGERKELENGQRVAVFGPWDAASEVVRATLILVLDGPQVGPVLRHVRGTVTTVDPAGGSFTVEPRLVLVGGRPMARVVTVRVTDATVFVLVPGGPATFDDVQVGSLVDVVGDWESTTSTMTAARVLIIRRL